ncbi:uncharacterized protein LOC131935197 [Physella acuta]|uniref:uncharacterized protein LOC131935197 n=1 Tax=Physella acuta TaxID=109671 RepID=UPI0027DB5FA3|nr:uncharacterized protein LOC131935197 [Physella acuta]
MKTALICLTLVLGFGTEFLEASLSQCNSHDGQAFSNFIEILVGNYSNTHIHFTGILSPVKLGRVNTLNTSIVLFFDEYLHGTRVRKTLIGLSSWLGRIYANVYNITATNFPTSRTQLERYFKDTLVASSLNHEPECTRIFSRKDHFDDIFRGSWPGCTITKSPAPPHLKAEFSCTGFSLHLPDGVVFKANKTPLSSLTWPDTFHAYIMKRKPCRYQ